MRDRVWGGGEIEMRTETESEKQKHTGTDSDRGKGWLTCNHLMERERGRKTLSQRGRVSKRWRKIGK